MNEAEYWINKISQALDNLQETWIEIGEGLKKLRGDKYKKAAHLWKQDPNKPEHLTTFAEYCKWKWNLSEATINQYIRAFEIVEDIGEDTALAVSSPTETEEFVLRPLTPLKKEDRQEAWEYANKIATKEGKKLSNRHTARASIYIRNRNVDREATLIKYKKEGDKQDRAELGLVQTENLGIAEPRAKAKVTECLDRLFRDENEKAKLYLARLLADRIFKIYPQLLDEPIQSFSLQEFDPKS